MLTYRMRDLLKFIGEYQTEHGGVSPNYTEMAAALHLKSRSGAYVLVRELSERGFVRKLPNRHRAIEIIKRAVNDPSSA